ncbi:MAG: neutral/alkaline non-lysosomal ceramidase N-terminal domain-containing protein [Planctomycetales bacterium]|nr:neutral/alkaline non-lysosomal ceramidase N-terminal domain-containing protein [Planctomycetales bacterium]
MARANYLHSTSRYKLVTACLLFVVFGIRIASGEILVGLSQIDITPPPGGLTTGYASAQPTDGVHDPVSARVMLLRSNNSTVALVSCDLCIFNSAWLHEQMPALGIDRLLLMNTHTHAGPKLSQEDFPSVDKPWRKTVEERIIVAIKQAQSSFFKGYFAASESNIQLGYNRLVRRGDYAVTHFDNPERIPYGSVDPQVGAIRIADEDSKVRAVIINYACHPVVLGPRNTKISADYPGVTRRIVESKIGGDVMCVFVQGAGGDINPLFLARDEERDHDFDLVERMGAMLASEVMRALAFIDGKPGRSDECLCLSSESSFRHRFNADEQLTLGTSTLLINNEIGIITMPGEPFHSFQLDCRDKANVPHMYLFGYCCNGPYEWPSYLPDLVSAARGGYGASDTTKAEVGCGERLVNTGLVQLFQLQGRLKSEPMRHTFDEEPK